MPHEPTSRDENGLARHLAGLADRFAALGARLSDAARAMEISGVLPAEALLEELVSARTDFNEVRRRVLELAHASDIAAIPPPEAIASLTDLQPVLQAIAEAEYKKRLENTRRRALAVLECLLATATHDHSECPPLLECQAKARDLHRVLAGAEGAELPADALALAEGAHPFCALLALAAGSAEMEDGAWDRTQEAVTHALGRPLAVAAARGRLRVPAAHAAGLVPCGADAPRASDSSPESAPRAEEREREDKKPKKGGFRFDTIALP